MLTIKNLYVATKQTPILEAIDLKVETGSIHAIMGPNGSGKSTLAKVIAAHPAYEIREGELLWQNQSINDLDAQARAHLGIFLAFQNPLTIHGVSNMDLLRLTYQTKHKDSMDAITFLDYVTPKLLSVGLHTSFLNRYVNDGFSGGEKKKNEILQMAILEPKLAILDEIDSGLDIDALKQIAHSLNQLKTEQNAYILITHYPRLLEYVKPDYVHVMYKGRIALSGDASLSKYLEQYGYDEIKTK
jgi:Fe-S cluster assembly ATP-binding protein|uniref:Probable ATP-dependent transporter ycf16 n=1 Tax=Cyanidiaceae sp. MX-AZ01 TaxID=1503164 RepID=A0A060A4P9_9RHOD|nr:sulfate ABC transporter protein [Cyanidiaceae sp. MX-AZ01]